MGSEQSIGASENIRDDRERDTRDDSLLRESLRQSLKLTIT
jgi:hypothetical protein